MKRWRIPLLAAALVVAAALAFFLQDVIRQAVLVPLAYLWWLIRFYYTVVPQLIFWVALLVLLLLIISNGVAQGYSSEKVNEKLPGKDEGPVENLAGWITKIGKGNYYKWRVANRLGKLARGMLDRRERRELRPGRERLDGPGWNPPEAVRRYLEAGLNESFVDYPRPPLPFIPKLPTPFDLDPDKTVGFLESEMEERSERRHP